MGNVFISHSSRDRDVADALAEALRKHRYESLFLDSDLVDGIHAGKDWEQELYRQLRACDAVVFIASSASIRSKWCFAEVAIARSLGKRIFPVRIGEARFPLLSGIEWVQVKRESEEWLDQLWPELERVVDPLESLPWRGADPYPGLAPFDADHAGVFFGRTDQIRDALDTLQKMATTATGSPRALAIVGASGSGKSSLLRAGILPRIARSQDWLVVPPFTPHEGDTPIEALARRLAASADDGTTWHEVAKRLRDDPAQLSSIARDLLDHANAKANTNARARAGGATVEPRVTTLLLAIDQAEELFHAEESDRLALFECLRVAIGATGSTCLVFTMRSEFTAIQDAAVMKDLLETQMPLWPLDREQLRAAIERPATMAGVQLDTGLADRILDDVGGSDVLPLLAFTLRRLFDERGAAGTMSEANYERLGGVEGALRSQADDAYADLARRGLERAVLPTLRRFVELSVAGEVVGRTVPMPAAGPERDVVEQFVEDRLLVAGDSDEARPTVGVAHEALFRAWPPLERAIAGWMDELRFRGALQRDAAEWWKNGQDPEFLYHGARVARAAEWRAKTTDPVDETVRQFIEACDRAAHRRRRWLTTAITAAAVFFLAAFLVTLVLQRAAQHNAADAVRQSRIAASRELAAESESNLSIDPQLSLLLARAAVDSSGTDQAKDALFQALAASLLRIPLRGHTDAVTQASFSPDGTRVVTASDDGTARVWDVRTGRTIRVLHGWSRAKIRAVAFSPDSRDVVIGAADGTWRILNASTGRSIAPPAAPPVTNGDAVNDVRFSPDGSEVLTGNQQGTATLWNAVTGTELHVLPRIGHTGAVVGVNFSDDRAFVVTASSDGDARIWSASTGDLVHPLTGHAGTVWTAEFSPDGRRVVTASADGTAGVWNATNGKNLLSLHGHAAAVNDAEFSPDGRWVVTASADRTARVWDAETGKQLAIMTGHTAGLAAARFSPDGRRVLTSSSDTTARIWDAATGAQIAVLRGHADQLKDAEFSPNGAEVATASLDQTARIWDAATNQIVLGHQGRVLAATFSSEGTKVVTASEDGTARVWNATSGAEIASLHAPSGSMIDAEFSPDGRKVVAASNAGLAWVWDHSSDAQVELRPDGEPPAAFLRASFSPDGAYVMTSSVDGTARVWNAVSGEEVFTLEQGGRVLDARFNADGTQIVTTSDNHAAAIWDAVSGHLVHPLVGHTDRVLIGDFSPDGRVVVTASADRTARVWDVATGRSLHVLSGHGARVLDAEFSPHSQRIVTAADDGVARVWDARSGRELFDLRGNTQGINAAEFSPNGRWIATAGADATVRLWDASNGQEIAVLLGHDTFVSSVEFSPDGSSLVTASQDDTARVFSCRELCRPFPELLKLLPQRIKRSLTPDEVITYLHRPPR